MILWRSTRPTLFPYTTLFRSAEAARENSVDDGDREPGAQEQRKSASVHGCEYDVSPLAWLSRWGRLDRKSTRLNSSHMSISYAVFCLKKKIKVKNILALALVV